MIRKAEEKEMTGNEEKKWRRAGEPRHMGPGY